MTKKAHEIWLQRVCNANNVTNSTMWVSVGYHDWCVPLNKSQQNFHEERSACEKYENNKLKQVKRIGKAQENLYQQVPRLRIAYVLQLN